MQCSINSNSCLVYEKESTMTTKKTLWPCKRPGCEKNFYRYPYQIRKGLGKYCSQSCSGKDTFKHPSERKTPIYNCDYCNIETPNWSKKCKECRRILNRVREIGLDNYTPLDYYNLLLEQNNKCAICFTEKCVTGNSFSIDHDHITGKPRGLLCYSCNHKLGWYELKKDGVDNYLKKYMPQ